MTENVNYIDKEVYFVTYCPLCKHEDKAEIDEPCRECLDNTVNQNSHKPLKFEEK